MTIHDKRLNIPEDLFDEILSITKPLKYTTSSNLFYAGQTPIVAYLVLSGLIHFTVNGEVINTFGRGNIIGLKELMNNDPLNVNAQARPGTEVCFIDRSTVLQIMGQTQNSPLKELISKLIKLDTSVKHPISI